MKYILFLNSKDSMTHGGAEEIIRLTAMHFIEQGDDVHMFFLLEKRFGHWEKINKPNLHLYYSSGGGKWGIFSVLRNFWRVHNITFDYSFSSIAFNNGLVGLMKRCGILKINHIIGRESTLVFKRFKGLELWFKKLMYRIGYPAVDTVVCQTDYMRQDLLGELPWLTKRSKVIVIPNPVDMKAMNDMAAEPIDSTRYEPFVVACGRLHPVKAYDLLLTAFARLLGQYPELNLVILGEGLERKRLEDIALDLNIADRVHMPGEVPNVYPYFKKAELCAVTSHIEGFPNVLLQMMSQNERVVSTTCAGGIENIKGLITCKPSDVNALTETLLKGLQVDVSGNRELFDMELQSRSIDKFVQKATNVNE